MKEADSVIMVSCVCVCVFLIKGVHITHPHHRWRAAGHSDRALL